MAIGVSSLPSALRIANVAVKDVMILPYDAHLGRMGFSEKTRVEKGR
jgi:hypothetical protein